MINAIKFSIEEIEAQTNILTTRDEVSGLGTQCPLFRKSYVGVAIRLKVVRTSEEGAAIASYSGAGVVF